MISDPIALTAVHSTFRLERYYEAPPARVFHAFADDDAKQRWLVESEGFVTTEYSPDFKVGGNEVYRFRFGDGPEIVNQTSYLEIVSNERLIFCYQMAMAGVPMSVSLTTIEFIPQGSGTLLLHTEQGAYLDGRDDGTQREAGTRELHEALAREVER